MTTQRMTKLEKLVEALRERMLTCNIKDFTVVQEEFFRVQKLAIEHRNKLEVRKARTGK